MAQDIMNIMQEAGRGRAVLRNKATVDSSKFKEYGPITLLQSNRFTNEIAVNNDLQLSALNVFG